nr:hypothetical protein CFP56_01270 [Quercus suber]
MRQAMPDHSPARLCSSVWSLVIRCATRTQSRSSSPRGATPCTWVQAHPQLAPPPRLCPRMTFPVESSPGPIPSPPLQHSLHVHDTVDGRGRSHGVCTSRHLSASVRAQINLRRPHGRGRRQERLHFLGPAAQCRQRGAQPGQQAHVALVRHLAVVVQDAHEASELLAGEVGAAVVDEGLDAGARIAHRQVLRRRADGDVQVEFRVLADMQGRRPDGRVRARVAGPGELQMQVQPVRVQTEVVALIVNGRGFSTDLHARLEQGWRLPILRGLVHGDGGEGTAQQSQFVDVVAELGGQAQKPTSTSVGGISASESSTGALWERFSHRRRDGSRSA